MAHVLTAPHGEHKWLDWKAGVWAGLIAGVVFLALEMGMVWLIQGDSPWGPPRMIAAIVLGRGVLPPPATFDFGIVLAAIMVHFVLAAVYGLIAGALLHRIGKLGVALAIGAAFGLVIYLINFYLIAPAAFPWFATARGWIGIFAHIVFGVASAAAYFRLLRHKAAAV